MPSRGAPAPTKRHNYDFSEAASALQKSVRRGMEDDALFWAVELAESGYEEYVWKRLRIMASEDVGIADPMVCVQVQALYQSWQQLSRKREDRHRPWRLMMVQAVIVLARAKKSRVVDHALIAHYEGNQPNRPVPDVAHDKHTLQGKRMGRGFDHFWEEGTLLASEEGTLEYAPNLVDVYREQAIAATTTPKIGEQRQLNWHANVEDK